MSDPAAGNAMARLDRALDALAAGDNDLVAEILLGLRREADARPTKRSTCPECGITGWPGAIEDHRRVVHGVEDG